MTTQLYAEMSYQQHTLPLSVAIQTITLSFTRNFNYWVRPFSPAPNFLKLAPPIPRNQSGCYPATLTSYYADRGSLGYSD
jgi:hypothetical protein